MYETIECLPGLARDEYGNLEVSVIGKMPHGLRNRIEYALRLEVQLLSGTNLAELLDWMRWGSMSGVMWECTLAELIQIIEKWLTANPDADRELFGFVGEPQTDWNELWNQRGFKTGQFRRHRCKCGILHEHMFGDCNKCFQVWFDMEEVICSIRGPNTYNLSLNGAGGGSVAAAVWQNRNWLLVEPEAFYLDQGRYVPTF